MKDNNLNWPKKIYNLSSQLDINKMISHISELFFEFLLQ